MKLTGWSCTCFIKTKITLKEFIQTGASNHLHSVRGDFSAELIEWCNLYGIEYEFLG